MKYVFITILLSIALSSCAGGDDIYDGVFQVNGVHDGIEGVRGMGVCIGPHIFLTSNHVVRDDTINYEIGGITHQVTERDSDTDIAYLGAKNQEGIQQNICSTYKKYTGKKNIKIGGNVSIPVIRSGSLIVLTGTVITLTGSVLAYDTIGRTQIIRDILITDISLEPGDSGAPILDGEGRVVDVVHVE